MFSMQNSVAFAKWVLVKFRSDIIENNEFDFVISQLDDPTCIWQEFSLSQNHTDASKNAVDNIIPQLVQKMPKKPRQPKGNNKGKSFRTDAQTSTDPDDMSTSGLDLINPQTSRDIDNPIVEKKKRVYKKKQPLANATSNDDTSNDDDTANATSNDNDTANATSNDNDTAIVAPVEKKKRVYKKKQQPVAIDSANEEFPVVNEEAPVEKKKRGPKKKTDILHIQADDNTLVEVIVPTDSLQEEPFEFNLANHQDDDDFETTELVEVFIGDTLFYTNKDDQWFDSHFNPIANPQ